MNLKNYVKLIRLFKKNRAHMMNVAGCACSIVAAVETGKATLKAIRAYDESDDKSVKFIVTKIVPYYIPAGLFAASSVTLNFSSNVVHIKKNRKLTSALLLTSNIKSHFMNAVKETISDKNYEKVEKKMAEMNSESTIDGELIVYDPCTDHKFVTTYEKLRNAEEEVNRLLNDKACLENSISLNRFYRMAEGTGCEIGACHEWSSIDLIDTYESSWINFTHVDCKDTDGRKMCILRYFPEPSFFFE